MGSTSASRSKPKRKQPAEQLDGLLSSDLIEAVPDAIVAVDRNGVILRVNSKTDSLFGYDSGELIGQKIEVLVPQRYRQQHQEHRGDFAEHPKPRRMGAGLELLGIRKDGREFPVEISLSPVTLGDSTIVLSAIRDVTQSSSPGTRARRIFTVTPSRR